MQKLVYLSNSRDYTEQGNINENRYFKHVNALLDEGWEVSQMTPNTFKVFNKQNLKQNETFAVFVLLEKSDEKKQED